MNSVISEAVAKLRQLSFGALADRLEHNTKNTTPEAAGVLREHYFYQLADRLAAFRAVRDKP